ncbi:MAG: helix-turn-helix transcriptional regulator [Acidimicrobiales bacterium]|jgi:transcriptional regulator with XRE-family HTH domain
MGRTAKRTAAQTELGLRVRRLRTAQGLSQMALADRIGLHFTFVSTVERGERNLSLSSLLRIAEGLGVDPAELVRGLMGEPQR